MGETPYDIPCAGHALRLLPPCFCYPSNSLRQMFRLPAAHTFWLLAPAIHLHRPLVVGSPHLRGWSCAAYLGFLVIGKRPKVADRTKRIYVPSCCDCHDPFDSVIRLPLFETLASMAHCESRSILSFTSAECQLQERGFGPAFTLGMMPLLDGYHWRVANVNREPRRPSSNHPSFFGLAKPMG